MQVPRDRLGTFRPALLPKYARMTGGLEEMILSLTATEGRGVGVLMNGFVSAVGTVVNRFADPAFPPTHGRTRTSQTVTRPVLRG